MELEAAAAGHEGRLDSTSALLGVGFGRLGTAESGTGAAAV